MKKIILILLSLIIFGESYSQDKYSLRAGSISQFEMDMTEYPQDPEAEAVVIYEKGDYRFVFSDRDGLLLEMTIHTKIKILSQAGEKYASFEIPIYKRDSRNAESLDDISGITYNVENGQLVKTEFNPKGNVFEEKINNTWDLKKFTLPNVKVGSVIEVKYKISTPFFVNMREWNFQKKIPVVHSKLQYRAIPYYEYVFSATHITKFDEFTSTPLNDEIRYGALVYREMEYVFALNDIPAFRDEEFISTSKDYMISLKFQLARIHDPRGGKTDFISTWEALTKDLMKHSDFGKYINDAKKEARKILPTMDLVDKTDKEKCTIIADYVKRNFNWNGFYGEHASQKVSNLLKNKRGNVADINLFLIGMLEEAKLNVVPVILSTRDHGRIDKQYPFIQYFNYVLAEVTVDNGRLFVDATEPMLPSMSVPSRCVNTEGLTVEKVPKWTPIRQKIVSFLQRRLELNIKSVNDVEVKASYGASGQAAYLYRTNYLGKNEHLAKYLKDKEDINTIGEIDIRNYQETDKIFEFDFSFNTKAEGTNEKIFINPFVNLLSRDNLFKQSSRALPIDINESIIRKFVVKINIPEGYEVESVPKTISLGNDVMLIDYKSVVADGVINIEGTYSFLDHLYPADKYPMLKGSYAKMLSKFTEMIVFSKKQEVDLN